jgi:hypothetical protein
MVETRSGLLSDWKGTCGRGKGEGDEIYPTRSACLIKFYPFKLFTEASKFLYFILTHFKFKSEPIQQVT